MRKDDHERLKEHFKELVKRCTVACTEATIPN